MNFQKKNNFSFLCFTLGFIAVVVFMYFFNKDVDNQLSETEIENISLTANQQQASINGVLESHKANLLSMSRTLIIIDTKQEIVEEYLENLEKNLDIETILFANTYGYGHLSNGDPIDIIGNPAFEGAMTGNLSVSEPYISKFTGKKVVAAASPVMFGGSVVAVVMIEYTMEYIQDTLIALVDEADQSGYSFLVDSAGDILASTSYKNEHSTPFEDASYENGVTYESLLADIVKRKPEGGGVVSYANDEKRILEYRPINIRDWSLIVVSEDTSNTLIRNIADGIQYILMTMAMFFFLFLAYILYMRKKGVKEIEHVAFFDEVTGLPNLVYFREIVKELMKKHPNMQFTMQKMDIKNFKAVNEMFGHEVGNLVLTKIAETVKSVQEPTFVTARVGADEFLMFSGNGYLNQDNQARENTEAYFKSLIPELAGHEFAFRYGRYSIEEGEKNVMEIINKTNMAHHMAKTNPNKKICEYDDSFKKRILRIAEINNKRKNAIENKEFKVYLQAKVNIFENKLCGAEALVRWIESDGKMIYPNDFIPLFEQNGFIVNVDIYILKGVCRQIKTWMNAGLKIVPISVNFSRLHLQNPNFVKELKAICDSYGDIRQYIEIELTESAATENIDELSRVLAELHDAGFSVAIDDFGAGYSSLGMLKNFTVDTLKLDKSFFDEAADDSRGASVVSGIIQVAKALEMKIVAEGIEVEKQIEFLKTINCEIVQGYYYSKPIPLLEFEQTFMGEHNEFVK